MALPNPNPCVFCRYAGNNMKARRAMSAQANGDGAGDQQDRVQARAVGCGDFFPFVFIYGNPDSVGIVHTRQSIPYLSTPQAALSAHFGEEGGMLFSASDSDTLKNVFFSYKVRI